MLETLPESRLLDPKDSIMVEMTALDGTRHRLEYVPIFCASCGHSFANGYSPDGLPYGYVPKDSIRFIFWLCDQCFQTYGEVAGTKAQPDYEFCQAVQAEMQARFGRDLTDLELFQLSQQGKLGRMLELLEKESPYKVSNP